MAESTGVKHHNKFFDFVVDHKIISFLIGLALVGGVYYEVNAMKANNTPKRYGVTQAQKGTLIVSVTGSGQVLAESQIDIKPKVSGPITAVNVKEGDKVTAGQTIAQIDSTNARNAVRDAQLNLKSAQVALQKLVQPADNLSLIQAQNDYAQAQRDLQTLTDPPDVFTVTQDQNAVDQAERDLEQAQVNSTQQSLTDTQSLQTTLDNSYNSVSNAFVDAPTFITDIESVKTSNTQGQPSDNVSSYENILTADSSFITNFLYDYDSTIKNYNTIFDEYKATNRDVDEAALYTLLNDTVTMEKSISVELENARNLFDAITTRVSDKSYFILDTINILKPKIETDISTLNKDLDDLQTAKNNLDNLGQNSPINAQKSADAITAAQANLKEKQQALQELLAGAKAADIAAAKDKVNQTKAALDKVKAGPDPLDVQNQQLTIDQRKNALADAQTALADYTVKSPFDGIIATVTAVKGDNASSGTPAATIITKQLLAQISLNEVDVAKVKMGDKATLTFDAVPDVSITGELVQIDTIGTSTQGVVNYNAKISFDTQDARIKPGMSVSAAVITSVDQDVLLVPNAALKTQGTVSYVNVFDNLPNQNSSADTSGTGTGSTSNIVTSLAPPQQKFVEVGASNDTNTEITSGLNEGENVVTQTYSDTAAGGTAAAASSSAVRIPGLTGGTSGGLGGGGFAGGARAGAGAATGR